MSNRPISWKALGLVVVVFVLGIALGAVAIHVWDAHAQASQHRRSVVKELKEELNLTPDQEKQFDAIISVEHSQFNALDVQQRAEWNPKFHALSAQEHAEWDPKWDQVRQQGRGKIRAILTAGQRVKFDAFLKRLDAEIQRRRQQDGN